MFSLGNNVNSEQPSHCDIILEEIIRRLIESYEPLRIYLFGSQARGDSGPDSDYDLMVIVPDNAPTERRRSRLAYHSLWGIGTAADILVWTQSAFDSRTHLVASLPATILREGKLLYAARPCEDRRNQSLAG
ncbi:nucleotidyltransferase domain-containing protein [Desulfobacca acetoxidans]|uniref:nucleotidyltransferase domain-containing protein n=1 Tax=Desulfobacca acetoxidans TaxID=60893 RepID=UPI0011D1C302